MPGSGSLSPTTPNLGPLGGGGKGFLSEQVKGYGPFLLPRSVGLTRKVHHSRVPTPFQPDHKREGVVEGGERAVKNWGMRREFDPSLSSIPRGFAVRGLRAFLGGLFTPPPPIGPFIALRPSGGVWRVSRLHAVIQAGRHVKPLTSLRPPPAARGLPHWEISGLARPSRPCPNLPPVSGVRKSSLC